MNVLYFSPTSLGVQNGIVRRLTETAHHLHEMGDRVLIVAPHGPGKPDERLASRVLTVPSLPLPWYPGFAVGLPYWSPITQAHLKAFQADLVHVLDPVTGTGWLAQSFAHQQRLPLVASYHTHLPSYFPHYGLGRVEPLLWRYLQQMFAHASLTFCPSTSIRDQLRAHGWNPMIHLWPSGVDEQCFRPTKRNALWRERLTQGHHERCILLSVGRLAAEKQIQDLFCMLAALPGCHLALVGDGPYRRHLQREARDLPITFLGPLHAEDLAQAYASADLFVQPSRSETFGNVTLEAMASGVAVVAAAAGGSLDLITHEHNGLLYTSPEEAIQALRRLQQHAQFRSRLADTARLIALQRSWWLTTKALRQHYITLLETMSPRGQGVSA